MFWKGLGKFCNVGGSSSYITKHAKVISIQATREELYCYNL
jgi:hypothetical protein